MLPADAGAAVASAETYILNRQSGAGGFCFGKSGLVDEPNPLANDVLAFVLARQSGNGRFVRPPDALPDLLQIPRALG